MVVALSVRCASGGTSREVLRLRSLVLQLQTQMEAIQAAHHAGPAPSDSQGITEQTLMCVDAKLLQLAQESSRVQQMLENAAGTDVGNQTPGPACGARD